jgi:hypothetical protein
MIVKSYQRLVLINTRVVIPILKKRETIEVNFALMGVLRVVLKSVFLYYD